MSMKQLSRGKSRWRALFTALVFLLSYLIVSPMSGAMAAEGREESCQGLYCSSFYGDSVAVRGTATTRKQAAWSAASNPISAASGTSAFEFVRSQVCGGPGYVPEGGTGCGDARCVDPGATRVSTARRAVGAPAGAGWELVGDRCATPGAPAAAGAAPVLTVAEVIATEFAALPLAGATARVQPAGDTLVNIETIFWTDAGVQTFDVVILGQPVRVHATPIAYGWTFGDGASLGPTTSAGAPFPSQDITHTYLRPGTVSASVAVTFTGTFTVAGAPPAAIPGQVTAPGPDVEVRIREAHSQLVANPDS